WMDSLDCSFSMKPMLTDYCYCGQTKVERHDGNWNDFFAEKKKRRKKEKGVAMLQEREDWIMSGIEQQGQVNAPLSRWVVRKGEKERWGRILRCRRSRKRKKGGARRPF